MNLQLKINNDLKSHILSLDGLRGIAIILILLYHCFPSLYKVGTGIGWMGIDLFLVLSGFLVAGKLMDTKGDPYYIKYFFRGRILKFLPLYFMFLSVFFFILPISLGLQWLSDYQFYYTNQIWYWLCGSNVLVALQNNWPPVAKPILDHFWVVGLLFQFYLIVPFMVNFMDRNQLLIASIFLIILSVVLRNIFESLHLSYSTSYVFTLARFDSVFTGVVFAIMIRNEAFKKVLEKWASIALIATIFFLIAIIFYSKSLSLKNEYFIRIGYTVIAILFGLIILHFISPKAKLQRIAESPILLWFSQYSFGIYIYHWFLHTLFANAIDSKLYFIQSIPLRSLLASTISLSFILLIALLSWHCFEKFFLKMGRMKAGKIMM